MRNGLVGVGVALFTCFVSNAKELHCADYLSPQLIAHDPHSPGYFKRTVNIGIRCIHGIGCSPVLRRSLIARLTASGLTNFSVSSGGGKNTERHDTELQLEAQIFMDLVTNDYYITANPKTLAVARKLQNQLPQDVEKRRALVVEIQSGEIPSQDQAQLYRRTRALEVLASGGEMGFVKILSFSDSDLLTRSDIFARTGEHRIREQMKVHISETEKVPITDLILESEREKGNLVKR